MREDFLQEEERLPDAPKNQAATYFPKSVTGRALEVMTPLLPAQSFPWSAGVCQIFRGRVVH